MIGGILGFGWYNVVSRKKSIHMGDTGTLVVGFLLAILAIRLLNLPEPVIGSIEISAVNAFVLLVFLVPVSDMMRIILVRMLKRRSPFRPDRLHIHYRMVDAGLKPLQVSGILFSYNLLMICLGINVQGIPEWLWMSIMVLFTVLLFLIPGRIIRIRKLKKN
jgi:UDP-N-acetylmuramyl pentapeptide phosphotransferase/UDP-N-acetylglucosamine-1-phosphate transferase